MILLWKENIQICVRELKSDPKYVNHYESLGYKGMFATLFLPFPITAALVQILILFVKHSGLYFNSSL